VSDCLVKESGPQPETAERHPDLIE